MYMYIPDLPTLPEFPGLSRKNDAYPLPRVLVQNSRAEFVYAARCARVIARDGSAKVLGRHAVCEASRHGKLVEISQISYRT